MHELLAPLLYVLHVDVEHLSEVRKAHEDHFADIFDGFSYHENDSTYTLDFKKFSESPGDGTEFDKSSTKANSLTELDPVIQTIVLLSDAYGAESELGIVLSEKFMEHDAYSMFDALMSGAGGVVAMAEFFSPSPYGSSHSGFTPIIEASSAMYHLLSVVDSPLHNHLVELGVEPQYFSLRWLRVLFGREFSLEDLLVIWDEIFACDNSKFKKGNDSDAESNFGVLDSSRGAFISAFAVSMILNLRSSLLATEIATSCLQRLLNFPDDINLAKLIAKAKSLQALAVEVNNSNSLHVHPGLHDGRKQVNTIGIQVNTIGHTLSLDSSLLNVVSESYWEEKWRVLHKEEEPKQGAREEKVPRIRKSWSQRVRLRLHRAESDPPPSTENEITKSPEPSAKRSLLDDLVRQPGSKGNKENSDVENQGPLEVNGQDVAHRNFSNMLSAARSEENSPNFSDPPSPIHVCKDHKEIESESSSVASNSSVYEDDVESRGTNHERPPLRVPHDLSSKCTRNDDSTGKSVIGTKERKSLPGKLQWLRKLGRNTNEGTSERSSASDEAKVCGCGSGQKNFDSSSCTSSKGEIVDQTMVVSLRNLGQTMLENIKVLGSNCRTPFDENLLKRTLCRNVVDFGVSGDRRSSVPAGSRSSGITGKFLGERFCRERRTSHTLVCAQRAQENQWSFIPDVMCLFLHCYVIISVCKINNVMASCMCVYSFSFGSQLYC